MTDRMNEILSLLETSSMTCKEVAKKSGLSDSMALTYIKRLKEAGKVESTGLLKKAMVYSAKPKMVTVPGRSISPSGVYVPPQWANEIARPGGEQNRQYGSPQADGTVKPYRAPILDMTRPLKDKTDNARG